MSIVECYPGGAAMLVCILVSLLTNGAAADDPSDSDDVEPLIYNGTPTTIEQHPHLVSFQTKKGHFCGGAILDKNIVLTSGHCFPPGTNVRGIEAVAGRTKQSQYSKTEQLLEVERVIIHDEYSFLRHDIALVQTREDFQWTRQVRPSMMAKEWDSADKSIKIAGWGETEKGTISDVLLEASTKIDEKQCTHKFRQTFNPNNTFCVYVSEKETCSGDSGSPALNSNGEIIGIVSYGTSKCRKSASVATNVTHYLKWIDEKKKTMNDECKTNLATFNAISNGSEVPLEDLISLDKYMQNENDARPKLCGTNSVFRCFNTTCYCYLPNRLQLTYLRSLVVCRDYFYGSLPSVLNNEEDDFHATFLEKKNPGLWLRHKTNQTSVKDATGNTSIICVMLKDDLSWQEASCLQNLQSVCRIPYTKGKCEPGWASFRGHCYHVNSNHLTWWDAERKCGDAHLASVLNPDENTFITILLGIAGERKAWIGQQKRRPHNFFRWSDESPTNFTRLDPPLQQQSEDSEENECVLFGGTDYTQQARWRVSRCTAKYPSVCKTREKS